MRRKKNKIKGKYFLSDGDLGKVSLPFTLIEITSTPALYRRLFPHQVPLFGALFSFVLFLSEETSQQQNGGRRRCLIANGRGQTVSARMAG